MKKQTPVLRTLTWRSLKKNKGRNLVAVLAIFLTTMMFTTLFTLAQGLNKNITEMYLRQAGTTSHASAKEITDEQIAAIAAHPDVADCGKSIVLAIAENPELAGRQLELRYADDSYAAACFSAPESGRMPEAYDEIALDTLTLERLGVSPKTGASVTLVWRPDLNSAEQRSDTFTLCGWWEGNRSSYASMAWVSEEFALDACGRVGAPAPGQICGQRMMGISFSDSSDIDQKTENVLRDCNITDVVFDTNLAYSDEYQSMVFAENLPMYGGMAMVFLAGYLIIFNIFQISVGSDIRFYGRLKTLGMATRQLKRMIYGQGSLLAAAGIPAGLLAGFGLGVVLLPTLLASSESTPVISASPVIFIGSAVFACVTVFISCLLPARLAGRVSPIEALRYTDADTGGTKKLRRRRRGATIAAMAWANLWRSKKRTVLVICSLTLGLVLMSFFYAKNVSFDVEKYLMDMAVADYQLDDATNARYEGYDPSSRSISDSLLAQLDATGAVTAAGRLYSAQTTLVFDAQTNENFRAFYNDARLEEFASYDPSFPEWKERFDAAQDGEAVTCTVYGADGIILDAATGSSYLLNGSFDADAFATGRYCLVVGPATDPSSELPAPSIGGTVTVAGRDFEVMAVVSPLQPMVSGIRPVFDLPLILPADTFLSLWPDHALRKYYFDVTDEAMAEVSELLTEYQRTSAVGMNIVSRQSMVEQYEAQTRSSAVMGYAISSVIALVGVINFANSMITAIISRRREFAIIQSIGMTKRQLQQMLTFEGIGYAGITLAASWLLGAVTVGVIVRALVSDGFSTFRFTLFPLACCTPVLLLFAVILPYLCFRKLERQSVTERLRATE